MSDSYKKQAPTCTSLSFEVNPHAQLDHVYGKLKICMVHFIEDGPPTSVDTEEYEELGANRASDKFHSRVRKTDSIVHLDHLLDDIKYACRNA